MRWKRKKMSKNFTQDTFHLWHYFFIDYAHFSFLHKKALSKNFTILPSVVLFFQKNLWLHIRIMLVIKFFSPENVRSYATSPLEKMAYAQYLLYGTILAIRINNATKWKNQTYHEGGRRKRLQARTYVEEISPETITLHIFFFL